MLCAFFVVDVRNYLFLLSGDMVYEIMDYIFIIAIQESTSETDLRAMLFTCRQIRPIIWRLCRSRIPDKGIMNIQSNVNEDMKLALFWSFMQQIPSKAIFAGSFVLWLVESSEDRRDRHWVPYDIDVFLEQQADTTIKVIDVVTNSEKILQVSNFAFLICEFVSKIQDMFGYQISSVHGEDLSISNIITVTKQYRQRQIIIKNELRIALPMLNMLDLLSIQNGAFYKYDISLPEIFPITRLSFKMKSYQDEDAVRSVVSTFDINVCRIRFVHRKILLEFHAEDEIKKDIRKYYDYVKSDSLY